jgi:hypothetical protein
LFAATLSNFDLFGCNCAFKVSDYQWHQSLSSFDFIIHDHWYEIRFCLTVLIFRQTIWSMQDIGFLDFSTLISAVTALARYPSINGIKVCPLLIHHSWSLIWNVVLFDRFDFSANDLINPGHLIFGFLNIDKCSCRFHPYIYQY